MSRNIVKDYVEYDQKSIKKYVQIITNQQIDEGLLDAIIQIYIDVRYYDLYEHISSSVLDNTDYYIRKGIAKYLEKNYEKISNHKIKQNVNLAISLIKYIFCFEKATTDRRLLKLLDELEINIKKISLSVDESVKNDLFLMIKNMIKNKRDYLRKCECHDFSLKINPTNIDMVYDTELISCVKIPDLFSEVAINRVFSAGIISEDKLAVAYTLASLRVLQDILKFDYNIHYLLEFNPILLTKKNKLTNLLKIIDLDVLKDKLSFKISYNDFLENKDKVYELIHDGYQFAVIIDDNFKDNIQLLEVSSYIILACNNSDLILKFNGLDNIILID